MLIKKGMVFVLKKLLLGSAIAALVILGTSQFGLTDFAGASHPDIISSYSPYSFEM